MYMYIRTCTCRMNKDGVEKGIMCVPISGTSSEKQFEVGKHCRLWVKSFAYSQEKHPCNLSRT